MQESTGQSSTTGVLVSVVIPLYNKEATVGRSLRSVLAQTFSSFEVLVVDDGSTDGSAAKVCACADTRIRIIHQNNAGVSAARNRGIAEARGDLVAFLDADDDWEPHFLEAVVHLSKTYPSAGLFTTGLRRYWGPKCFEETRVRAPRGIQTGLVSDSLLGLLEGPLIHSSSVAIRKTVFDTMSGFPEGEHLGEDRDLWFRIALRYPVAFDTRILAWYRVDAGERVFDNVRLRPPLPPVVRSLRCAVAEPAVWQLTSQQLTSTKTAIDWHLMEYFYWLVDAGLKSDLHEALKREELLTLRFRLEGALLRYAIGWLPLPFVKELHRRPLWLVNQLRRCIRRSYEVNGRILLRRRTLPESLVGVMLRRLTGGYARITVG